MHEHESTVVLDVTLQLEEGTLAYKVPWRWNSESLNNFLYKFTYDYQNLNMLHSIVNEKGMQHNICLKVKICRDDSTFNHSTLAMEVLDIARLGRKC